MSLLQEFDQLNQGDVVTLTVPLFDELAPPGSRPATEVAIVSQTCDLVRASPATAAVAAIVQLHGDHARIAAKGASPGFVPLPALDGDAFVDLSRITSVPKMALMGQPVRPGIARSDAAARDFARAVGRRFSRFAFPDSVVEMLRPLERLIQKKATKPASLTGRFLAEVVQIRLQSEDWAAATPTVEVHVIFHAGVLAEWNEPDDTGVALGVPAPTLNLEAALGLIYGTSTKSAGSSAALYAQAVQALIERVRQDAVASGALDDFARLQGQVWSEDEFPLSLYRRSEQLDVDYLSPALVA